MVGYTALRKNQTNILKRDKALTSLLKNERMYVKALS